MDTVILRVIGICFINEINGEAGYAKKSALYEFDRACQKVCVNGGVTNYPRPHSGALRELFQPSISRQKLPR